MKNLGDSYDKKITVRLSDSQHKFLLMMSDLYGVSPSEFVRILIDSTISRSKKNEDEEIS